MMIPAEPPHARSALSRIQETAIEIVCRRLLMNNPRAVPFCFAGGKLLLQKT